MTTKSAVRGTETARDLRDLPTEAGDSRPILSIRAAVPEAEVAEFIAAALRDVRTYMEEHHVPPAGPPVSICRPVAGGLVDVEAGWPLARPLAGTSRIHSGALPRGWVHAGS